MEQGGEEGKIAVVNLPHSSLTDFQIVIDYIEMT
jgi:hypothetical protein